MLRRHGERSKRSGSRAGRVQTCSHLSNSRDYRGETAGKPALEGSSDPAFRGDPVRHNPEDLLLAALAGCHMLTYLAEAARAGLVVVAYEDEADATMALDGTGGRFTEVVLRPAVTVARGSDLALARRLHEKAHAERSEEPTSDLQSLMRNTYAVFCLT